MSVLPSEFAQSVYTLDGKPFSLKNRRYLLPIYDSDIEEGMIMSGRQVEKSTTESTQMANYTLLVPHFKGLYFAPLTEQIRTFSKERIGKLYEYSKDNVIKKTYRDTSCSNAVTFKEFLNGSVNYFRHCFEYGDNIRGITCNGVWGDEIQDIHIDAIPVIRETQSHARDTGAGIKITWFTGTPKTFSNTIQQYWDRSTQNEWVIKCQGCKKYQLLNSKILTPTKFICQKCGKELTKEMISNGRWYELQPGKKLKGFRISQLMVPWITADEIWEKYTTYSPDKFFNEVMGRSYENAEKPFNQLILNRLYNDNFDFYKRAEGIFANKNIFMGIDWGKGEKSKTVVTIFGLNNEGRFQLLYAKKYEGSTELDVDYQLKHISMLMELFKVNLCIADWGFGYVQYKKLQKIFGVRVAACYYSFNQKANTKWDRIDSKWVVNRTKIIQSYVDYVHEARIAWPGKAKNQLRWLEDHHLAELAEYRKTSNGRSEDLMFTHIEGDPDDGLHASVYAYLAFLLYKRAGNIKFSSAYGQNI